MTAFWGEGSLLQEPVLLLSLPAFRWHQSFQLKACAWQPCLMTALSPTLPTPWEKGFIPLSVAWAAEISSLCTL